MRLLSIQCLHVLCWNILRIRSPRRKRLKHNQCMTLPCNSVEWCLSRREWRSDSSNFNLINGLDSFGICFDFGKNRIRRLPHSQVSVLTIYVKLLGSSLVALKDIDDAEVAIREGRQSRAARACACLRNHLPRFTNVLHPFSTILFSHARRWV